MSLLDWGPLSVKLLIAEREAFDAYQAAWNRSNKANATAEDKAASAVAHDEWVKARTPLGNLLRNLSSS
jgi:hypothetical protein